MKKRLIIVGAVLLGLLLCMVILPFAFSGKIKKLVVSEGNKMLNAHFDFEDLSISLLRNFPQVSIMVDNLYVCGVDEFEGDTLVDASRVVATFNLLSLFGDNGYDIRKVAVYRTDVKAIVLENGRTNWDIMKADTTQSDTTTTQSESAFRIKLKNLTLSDVDVVYDDRAGKTYAALDDIELSLSGDFSSKRSKLKVNTSVEQVTVAMGGVSYLKEAQIKAKVDVDADFEANRFELLDNNITLNDISADVKGWIAILEQGYDMELTLGTNKIGFKELLSLVPAVYTKDFKSLKTSGTVSMEAWAKGHLSKESVPAFNVALKVADASLRYPALPKSIEAINISASATNPGGSADLTVIDINPLSFNMAGNPFAATLNVATPISDPNVKLTANGTLNLGVVNEVYPLDDTQLNGVVKADVRLAGRLSSLEKGQYDKFTASGSLGLSSMVLQAKDMPDVKIQSSLFTFAPQYLDLSRTTLNIGSSDITADCRLENYMAFALKGKTLKGVLNITSNNLNLNELMGAEKESAPEAEKQEGGAFKAFEVPRNIDFDMNTSLAKVEMDNLQFDNVRGKIGVHNGELSLNNLSFNTLGGSVVATGYYSTQKSRTQPQVDMSLSMTGLSFSQTFKSFLTVQKIAPIFESLKGDYSGSLKMDTQLDSLMTPLMSTLNGSGSIATKDINLSGIKALDALAGALKSDKLKDINVKDLKVDFSIEQGRIHTKPFDIKLGDTNINLSGSTGLDQSIDYSGRVTLPVSAGKFGALPAVSFKIGGTFASPKISLDTKAMANEVLETAKQQVTQKVLDEVGSKLGIDAGDATKQRQALIDAAQTNGDKLVEEAQKQADALVKKAGSNPLAKIGAKAAGDKLVSEAKKTAKSLLEKATAEGDKLVEKEQK